MLQQLEDPILLPTTPRAAKQHARDVIELSERVFEGLSVPWRLRSLLPTPDGAKKYALAISNLARHLAIVERYERRSLSQRKRALRKLVAEQRKSKGICNVEKSN